MWGMENPGGREEDQADRLGSLGILSEPRPGLCGLAHISGSWPDTENLVSAACHPVTSIATSSRGSAGRSTFSPQSLCFQAGPLGCPPPTWLSAPSPCSSLIVSN